MCSRCSVKLSALKALRSRSLESDAHLTVMDKGLYETSRNDYDLPSSSRAYDSSSSSAKVKRRAMRPREMAGVVLILCVLLLLIIRFRLSLASIAPAAYAYCNAQPMGGSEGSLEGVSQGARLVMVQVLARHGDRSAIHAIGATQVEFECGAPPEVQQQWGAFDTVRIEYTTGTITCMPRYPRGTCESVLLRASQLKLAMHRDFTHHHHSRHHHLYHHRQPHRHRSGSEQE
jgi:hypothetical protein